MESSNNGLLISNSHNKHDSSKNKSLNKKNLQPYFRIYFDIICKMGFSCTKGNGHDTKSKIKLAITGCVGGSTLLHFFIQTKGFVLEVFEKGNPYHYITAFYYFQGSLVVICFFFLIFRKKLSQFLKTFENDNLNEADSNVNKKQEKKVRNILLFVAIMTTACSFIWGSKIHIFCLGYSMDDFVKMQAGNLKSNLFQWEKQNYYAYGEEIYNSTTAENPTDVLYCFVQVLLRVVGMTQYNFIRDIMLAAAITIYGYSKAVGVFANSFDEIDVSATEAIWNEYKPLHMLSTIVQDCFGWLFLFINIDVLLFFAYFVLDLLLSPIDWASFIIDIISIVKVFLMYVFAVKANGVSGQIKRLLRIKQATCSDAGEKSRLNQEIMMLEQNINNCPVGIGSGVFLVNDGFLLRFLGSVVSSFMFFLRSEQEELTPVE